MKKASSLVMFPSSRNHASCRQLTLTRAVPLAVLAVLLAVTAPVRADLMWATNSSFGKVVVNGFNDQNTIVGQGCVDENLWQSGYIRDLNKVEHYMGAVANIPSVEEVGSRFHLDSSGPGQTFGVWVLAALGDWDHNAPPAGGNLVVRIRQASTVTSGRDAGMDPGSGDLPVLATTNFDAQASGQYYNVCWHHATITVPVDRGAGDFWFTVGWSTNVNYTFRVITTEESPGDILEIEPFLSGVGYPWSEGSFYTPMIVIEPGATTALTNTPPVANISGQSAGQIGNLNGVAVNANGSQTGHCNGQLAPHLTYKWSVSSAPTNSYGFGDDTADSTTFWGDAAGDYTIQLIVSNGCYASAPFSKTITLMGQPPPPATAPEINVANSGTNLVHAQDSTTNITMTTTNAGPHAAYTWYVNGSEFKVSLSNSITVSLFDMGLTNDDTTATTLYNISVMVTDRDDTSDPNQWVSNTSPSSVLQVCAWPKLKVSFGWPNWQTGRGEFTYDLPVKLTIDPNPIGMKTQGAQIVLLDQQGHTLATANLHDFMLSLPANTSVGPLEAFTYQGMYVWDDWNCTKIIPGGRWSTSMVFAVAVRSWQDANGLTIGEDNSGIKQYNVNVDQQKWFPHGVVVATYWAGMTDTVMGDILAAASFFDPPLAAEAAVEYGLQAWDMWDWSNRCQELHNDPGGIDTNFMVVVTVNLPQIDATPAVTTNQAASLAAAAAQQTMLINAELAAYNQTYDKLFGAYQTNSVDGLLLQSPELLRHAAMLDQQLVTFATNLLVAQQAAGIPSRQAVLDLQQKIATNGFPQSEVDTLQQLGYAQADIDALRDKIAALDLTSVPIGVPDDIDELLRSASEFYYNQAYGLVPGGWVVVAVTQPRPEDTVSGTITIDARVVDKKGESTYCMCGPALATTLSVDGNTVNTAPYPPPSFYPPPPNGNSYCPTPAAPYQQAVPFQLDTTTLSDGPHTITVTAMDSCQPGQDPRTDINSDTITIYVDNTPPLIILTSGDQMSCGDPITYQAVDPPVDAYSSGVVDPMQGVMSSKLISNSVATIRVADRAGNVTTTNVTVIVDDHQPPELDCPTNITVTLAAGQSSTNLSFSVTATDNCDPAPQVVCTPASGSAFGIGTTNVNCTATDASQNQTNASFTVTVLAPGSWDAWQWKHFNCLGCPAAAGNEDADNDGMSNTNEFLAGFNPTNTAACLHIISLAIVNSGQDVQVTYLGANGDSSYPGGPTSRTNVLEYACGTPEGGYTNDFVSTGQTNILSGGTGVGIVTNMLDSGGATNTPARYYRVRVLVP
ncbi:MAG TPA: HYR domain-containing protein [Verrucomicrobiae bacterium]|nr:HYR domain-containing protein [Verrucomicrobiae bacterium]